MHTYSHEVYNIAYYLGIVKLSHYCLNTLHFYYTEINVTFGYLIKFHKTNKTLTNSGSNTFNGTEIFKTLANTALMFKLNPLKDT